MKDMTKAIIVGAIVGFGLSVTAISMNSLSQTSDNANKSKSCVITARRWIRKSMMSTLMLHSDSTSRPELIK